MRVLDLDKSEDQV